jgi:hypothetical protein
MSLLRTLSGVPTGGPGVIFNNVHIGALNATDLEIFLFSSRAILYQGMVMCSLAGTVPVVSDMHSGRRAVTVGQFPLTGEGAMLTRRAVASAHTVVAHAAALLQQIIITLCSRARRCDVTTRRPPAHAAR